MPKFPLSIKHNGNDTVRAPFAAMSIHHYRAFHYNNNIEPYSIHIESIQMRMI